MLMNYIDTTMRKARYEILPDDGPYSGGKHQIMIKDNLTLRVPNPHQSDIEKELLARVLRQAGISKKDWEKL